MKKLFFILIFLLPLQFFAQVSLVYPKHNMVFDKTNLTFEWNKTINSSQYQIQIAIDEQFTAIMEDENTGTNLSYTALNLVPNRTYFWRVKDNLNSWSVIRKFTIVDFRSWSELEIMLDPDSVILDENGKVEQWTDLSGNGHDFSQGVGNRRPELEVPNDIKGNHVLSFKASSQKFLEGPNLSNLSQGEIFSLTRRYVEIPSSLSASGIWRFGSTSSTGDSDFYPSTTPNIALGWGRNLRLTIGNIIPVLDIAKSHVLHLSTGVDFRFDVNKLFSFSSTAGSVGFVDNCLLGKSTGSYYFDGQFGQILMFNSVLSDSIRELTYNYLFNKYAPPINLGANNTIDYNLCGNLDTLRPQKYFESYLWSDGSTQDSLIITEPGEYWVEATDVFGRVSRDTVIISYDIDLHPQTNICQNQSVTWDFSDEDNYTYDWSDGSHGKSLTISQPGNYFVTITDTNGCSYTTPTYTFQVDSFPSYSVLGDDKQLCLGNSLQLEDTIHGVETYLWSTGEATSSIEPQASDEYWVEATNTNGCIARDTVQVTILGSAPIADFDINLLTCTNSWDTYEDLSVSTDASTITAWEWDFGDGQISTAAQGIHNYVVSGNYPVSLKVTASNGCEQTLEKMVVVNTPPQVNFTTQFSCQGEAIKFNGTQSTSEFMTSWQWDFDDVNSNDNQAIGQNTQHIFADYGDHWVQLIGTDINGCSDTLQQMKSILPQPIPDFTFEDGCEKSNIVFTNASIMPEGGLIQGYNWNFGNGLGSQFPNPQAMYNNAGTYDVYLKVLGGNGCNNDTTMQINIHSLPAIAHLVEQDCAGIPVLFYDNSTANGDAIAQVQWRFNGGALKEGNPVSEVFSQEGPVAVQQIVTSDFGCKDSINYSVPIKSYLQAIFTTSPNTVIADVPFTIHNNSIGDVSHQFITQLGTTHQNDTSFIYTSDWLDSTVSIQLIIQNQHGCVDSTTQNFVVQNRNTDLAITNVISQEFNGYLKIGVEIKNNGSTPIQQAQLKLERVHDNPILEEWNGQLLAGESEVYIFHTMPLANVPLSDTANNYICVTGTITQPSQFLDEDLSNNQFCVTSSSTEMAIVETYPNPVKDELTIRIISQNEMNASITIYNEKGQTIQTVFQNQSLTKGLNTFIVDTQHWAKGVYLMKINQRIVKFVKG